MKHYNDIYFPLRERTALFNIFMTLLLIIAALYLRNHLAQPQSYQLSTKHKAKIEALIHSDSSTTRPRYSKYKPQQGHRNNYTKANNATSQKSSPTTTPRANFVFDPNIITKDSLLMLGVDQKTANTFENFRNKGAKFKSSADLMKVYGMDKYKTHLDTLLKFPPKESTNTLNTAQNSIDTTTSNNYNHKPLIINTTSNKTASSSEISTIRIISYEINSLDTYEIQQVRGIGDILSRRILEYRNKLGGFYDVDQLAEVYGLDTDRFNNIAAQLRADTTQIIKLPINTADLKLIQNHPYLKWKKGKILFNYRKNHYPLTSINDLRKIKIFNNKELNRLKPYLDFSTRK